MRRISRVNKEHLTVAAAAAAVSMTAALAEAEAAQHKMLEVDTTLADLAASLPKPSCLGGAGDAADGQEEGQDEEQAPEALTDGSSGTRVTGVRTRGMRECQGHPTRSQRVRRSGQSLPQPLYKTDTVARMKKNTSSSHWLMVVACPLAVNGVEFIFGFAVNSVELVLSQFLFTGFTRMLLRLPSLFLDNERRSAQWNRSWTCSVHSFTRTLLK